MSGAYSADLPVRRVRASPAFPRAPEPVVPASELSMVSPELGDGAINGCQAFLTSRCQSLGALRPGSGLALHGIFQILLPFASFINYKHIGPIDYPGRTARFGRRPVSQSGQKAQAYTQPRRRRQGGASGAWFRVATVGVTLLGLAAKLIRTQSASAGWTTLACVRYVFRNCYPLLSHAASRPRALS